MRDKVSWMCRNTDIRFRSLSVLGFVSVLLFLLVMAFPDRARAQESADRPFVTANAFLKEVRARFPFRVQNNGGAPFTTSVLFSEIHVVDNFTAVEIVGYEDSAESIEFRFKAPIVISYKPGVLVWMVDPSKPNNSPDDGEFIKNVVRTNAVSLGFQGEVVRIEATDNDRLYLYDSVSGPSWFLLIGLSGAVLLSGIGLLVRLRKRVEPPLFETDDSAGEEFLLDGDSDDFEHEDHEDGASDDTQGYSSERLSSALDWLRAHTGIISRVMFGCCLLVLSVSAVFLVEMTLLSSEYEAPVGELPQSEIVTSQVPSNAIVFIPLYIHQMTESFVLPVVLPPSSTNPRRRLIQEMIVHPDMTEFSAIGSQEGGSSGEFSFDGFLDVEIQDGRLYFVFGPGGRGEGFTREDIIEAFGERVEIKVDTRGAPIERISRDVDHRVGLFLDASKVSRAVERSSLSAPDISSDSPSSLGRDAEESASVFGIMVVFIGSLIGLFLSTVFMFKEG